jgi:hypothetical protein
MHQGIILILHCKELNKKLPSSTIKYKQAASGFRAVSRNEIIMGCVGPWMVGCAKLRHPWPMKQQTRRHSTAGIIMHRVSMSKRAVMVNVVLYMYQITFLLLMPSFCFANWMTAYPLLMMPTSTQTDKLPLIQFSKEQMLKKTLSIFTSVNVE